MDLQGVFRAVRRARVAIAVVFALAAVPAIGLALRVGHDTAIDRLIVEDDDDARLTRAFEEVFPQGDHAVLLAEAPDPFAPAVLERVLALEADLAKIPGVEPYSALSLYRRVNPGFGAGGAVAPADAAALRAFTGSTDLLRRQGLVGDGFLGIPLTLHLEEPGARDRVLGAIDGLVAPIEASPAPLSGIGTIGGPFVDAWLEQETARSTRLYFPLFGLFVVVLTLFLYRSLRTLAAFLLTIGACVLFAVACAAIAGWSFTIVSSLVPLTVLITATATLVYLHARFVAIPPGVSEPEHQAFAFSNKFLACTASLFAAAVGFAALAVSNIRPIYELGLWVAAGLVVTWVAVFTLFPALQALLRTPTGRDVAPVGARWPEFADALPRWSFAWRLVLVPLALLLSAAGAVALFGLPGVLAPMRLETDALDYIDRSLPLYHDTRRFEEAIGGLSVVDVWVRTPDGGVLEPDFLRGLESFAQSAESSPGVGSVVGPTTVLRWMRAVGGQGDQLPEDPGAWPALAGDLEQLLISEPSLRSFIDVGTLGSTHLTVIHRGGGWDEAQALRADLLARWQQAAIRNPALSSATAAVVGRGFLQAKISHELVPTLVESFLLTAGIIFVAFLLVFRSGAARILAIIPSLFALLVTFLLMRLIGIPLNVATILIASTVLGASENDQIHFFYHFQESRAAGGTTEQALRHTFRVSGQAILFATLINAGGFLALTLSSLPPMRQFGFIAAVAFLLSMLADFTVLPAALWMIFRERPDARS